MRSFALLPSGIIGLAVIVLSQTSCQEKSGAQRADGKIDKTVGEIRDAVDPLGPVEKASVRLGIALGR